MSLRARLLLATAVVALVALVGAEVATYAALRSFLYGQVGTTLEVDARSVAASITAASPKPPADLGRSAETCPPLHGRVVDIRGLKPGSVLQVRRPDGTPSVIANAPLLDDGTPMPTRYWLVDPGLREAVSRLEAAGGVREAKRQVDPQALARAHARYASERDALVPPDHRGPRPSGGVGGTRTGVKCLHAHLAWWLAGGEDPVGEWVARHLGLARPAAGHGEYHSTGR